MKERFSVVHTTAVAVTVVVVYFVVLYVGTPIIEWALNLYGRWFVPERYGGGRELDNPGVLTLLIRVLLMSGISAWAAFSASVILFQRAHARTVAVALGSSVIAWAGFLVFLMPFETPLKVFMGVLGIVFMAVPPLVITYILWCEESC